MRKGLFICLAVCVYSSSAATAHAGVLRYIGIKGAYSSTGASTDADSDFERRTGVSLGGEVKWGLGTIVSLHSDFEYSQRGWALKEAVETTGGLIEEPETQLNTLSIPILLQFTVPAVIVKPFIQIGPRLDFPIGIDSDLYGDDIPEEWKDIIVGGSIAVGVEFLKFHPLVINGSARYNFDFTNLEEAASGSDGFVLKNNALDVWVGLGYGFGPRPLEQ